MSFRDYTFIVPAGGETSLPVAGSSLYVVSATLPFKYSIDNNAFGLAEKDYSEDMPIDPMTGLTTLFKNLSVANPNGVEITVVIKVGSGRFRNNSTVIQGGVEITNTPTVNVAGFPVTFPDGLQVYERGTVAKVGASYANWYGAGAGPFMLFSAASNTGGAIIRSLDMADNAGSSFFAKLFIDTAAPSSVTDVTKKAASMTSWGFKGAPMPNQLYVPAGQGTWVVCQGNLFGCATWDLL